MERSAMEDISGRLASIEGLYFPGAIRSEAPDTALRKTALLDLLSRDASIFLERYGTELTSEELVEFEILRPHYEVEWHLDRLQRSRRGPTEAEARARSATVKNRRLAYMERLVTGGEYFSEDAMREREPYLHHEYVGRFQDPIGRLLSRPGERFSDMLLRRCQEAVLVEKIRAEQERLGIDRSQWVGRVGVEERVEEEETEEEEEEEEEPDEEGPGNKNNKIGDEIMDESSAPNVHENARAEDATVESHEQAEEPHEQAITASEMQYQLEQFTQIMQHKFLAGEDAKYLDYSKIDEDERLDDHWVREANFDAEEKYFDED